MHEPTLTGQEIAGRYQLEALLGQGGMGVVYRARDRERGGCVALKVVLPGEQGPRLIPRIMREARLAARLHHPHVVKVFDHGRWGEGRGSFFLTMELVDGVTLTELMTEPMESGRACELASQLLSALAHVHARGVLHRDIKPDNIMVSREPKSGLLHARLADFGLAAAFGNEVQSDLTRLTREGSVLGTPHYMAPEQIEGRSLGPAVDLYAVGLILYELLTNQLPFDGALQRILFDKLSKEPPRPERELPEGLADVLMRLVARRPDARFALAADALAALRPFSAPAPLDGAVWSALRGDTPAAHGSVGATVDATLVAEAELCGLEAERELFERCARETEAGEGVLVLLRGGPGIGKSALAESVGIELNEAGRFFVLRGRKAPGGGIVSALRAALEDHLGTRGLASESVEEVISASLRRVGESTGELAELMALMRPSSDRDAPDAKRASATFVRAIRRLAGDRPVYILLDDLLPDTGLSAFVELLLFEQALEPFAGLVVIPVRPFDAADALHATLARTAASEGRQRRVIDLGPLPVAVLAAHLERTRGLTPHAAMRVAERAEGNPLFALHFAAGDVSNTPVGSRDATSAGTELPTALRGLLEAGLEERLSRTPQRERAERLLRRIAVLGVEVDLDLLESFVEPEQLPWLEDDLDALIEVGILDDAGLDAVRFSQSLLRDVALATISARRRRRLHVKAAELRVERGRSVDLDVLGEHWSAAGDAERAAQAWVDAHARASARRDRDKALAAGRRALAHLPAEDPRRAAIALEIGRTSRRDASFDEAKVVLEPLLEHAEADVALMAAELLGEVAQELADIPNWERVVGAVRSRGPEGSRRGRAALLRAEAFLANLLMDHERAADCARQALELAETSLEELVAVRRLFFAEGGLDVSLESTLGAIRSAVERAMRDEPEQEAEALGLLLLAFPHDESAGEWYARLLEIDRRAGTFAELTEAMVNRAFSLFSVLEFEEALALARDGGALASRFSLRIEWLRANAAQVVCLVALGRAPEARLLAEEMTRTQGDHIPLIFVVLLDVAEGRLEGVREALGSGELLQMPSGPFFTVMLEVLGNLLLEADAPDLAGDVFGEAGRRYERYCNPVAVARVAARLEALAR